MIRRPRICIAQTIYLLYALPRSRKACPERCRANRKSAFATAPLFLSFAAHFSPLDLMPSPRCKADLPDKSRPSPHRHARRDGRLRGVAAASPRRLRIEVASRSFPRFVRRSAPSFHSQTTLYRHCELHRVSWCRGDGADTTFSLLCSAQRAAIMSSITDTIKGALESVGYPNKEEKLGNYEHDAAHGSGVVDHEPPSGLWGASCPCLPLERDWADSWCSR